MSKPELGRRAVLAGAGCAVFALLGACASESDQDPPAPAETSGDGPLIKAAEVPVGGGVVTPAGVLVLQLTAGNFTAFSATCPHQDFKVQAPDTNGTITCLGHMSHFKAADGSRIDGPAPKGLTPVSVKKDGDNIVRA